MTVRWVTGIRYFVWAGVSLGPFVLLALWLDRFAYDVFVWDDWSLLKSRFPSDDLEPSFGGLFSGYAGHRIPLLKLSVIAVITWADGDPRYLVGLSVLLSLGTAGALIGLLRRTLPAGGGSGLSTGPLLANGAVISLAVASPMLGHAWLWWICWVIFLPFLCLVLAIIVLGGGRERAPEWSWWRFGLVMFLVWIAAMAHAAGAVVWISLIPVLVLVLKPVSPVRRTAVIGAFALNGLAILWPFLREVAGPGNSGIGGAPVTFAKCCHYGLTLLGGSLGQGVVTDPLALSKAIGLVILAGVIGTGWVAIRRWPDNGFALGPWLSITLFGVLSALAITAGRANLPDEQALGGRYLLLTYPAWLGLFFFFQVPGAGREGRRPAASVRIIPIITLMIGLVLNGWFEGYRIFRWHHATRMARVAPTNFVRIFPEHPALEKCSVNVPGMIRTLERLDRHGKLRSFRLYETRDLDQFGEPLPFAPLGGGHVTGAAVDENGEIRIEGYAYLREFDRPADLILLSTDTFEGRPGVFCLVPMNVPLDFYHCHQRSRRPEAFTDWMVRLRPDQIPPGEVVIRAWAFNQETKRIHILRNTLRIRDGRLIAFEREVTGRGEID